MQPSPGTTDPACLNSARLNSEDAVRPRFTSAGISAFLTARGFTVIEMLAASAVFVIMITLLLSAVSQVNQAWRTSDGQKVRRESARALLDLMARDLQSAVAPIPGAQSTEGIFAMNVTPGTSRGDALFWRTAVPGDPSKSDVGTVGYYVNPATRTLIRYATNASTGFDLQQAASEAAQLNPDYANDFRGLLAEGVMGMFVTLYDKTGQPVAEPGDTASFTNAPPAAAEVTLVLADSRAAQRQPEYTVTGTNFTNLPEGMQVFRTRVTIPSGQ